jgi:excisionase family DNA binding protein
MKLILNHRKPMPSLTNRHHCGIIAVKEVAMSELLTIDQVAKILGVNRDTVRRYIHKGELPVIKLTPKTWRVSRDDLIEFLNRKKSSDEASHAGQ